MESPVEEKPAAAATGLALPKFGKGPLSPRSQRKGLRSPSPSMLKLAEEEEDEEEGEEKKRKKKDDPNMLSNKEKSSSDKKKFGTLEKKKLLGKEPPTKKPVEKEDPNIVRIDRSKYIDKQLQTIKIRQHDQEVQVEFYDEGDEDIYDTVQGFGQDFGFVELPAGETVVTGGGHHVDPVLGKWRFQEQKSFPSECCEILAVGRRLPLVLALFCESENEVECRLTGF